MSYRVPHQDFRIRCPHCQSPNTTIYQRAGRGLGRIFGIYQCRQCWYVFEARSGRPYREVAFRNNLIFITIMIVMLALTVISMAQYS